MSDVEWILPGGQLSAPAVMRAGPVRPIAAGRPEIMTTTLYTGGSFLEVASATVPYGFAKSCPQPLMNRQFAISGTIGAPPPTARPTGEIPKALCLFYGVSGEWQRIQAAVFLYQNGFKDLAAKLGYDGGTRFDLLGMGFWGEAPNQKCWIAPITEAQANEIFVFVAPIPGLRQTPFSQIVVSGAGNRVLRFLSDPLGEGIELVDAGSLLPKLYPRDSHKGAISGLVADDEGVTWLGIPPIQQAPIHLKEPEPTEEQKKSRIVADTDNDITWIPSAGILMRVQLASENFKGILLIETSSDCGHSWDAAPILAEQVTYSHTETTIGLSGFDGSVIYYHPGSDRIYVGARSGDKTVLLSSPAKPRYQGAFTKPRYYWDTTLVTSPGDNNPLMTWAPTAGSKDLKDKERLFVLFWTPALFIIEDPVSFTGTSPTVHTVNLAGLPVPASAQSGMSTLPPTGNYHDIQLLSGGKMLNRVGASSIVPLDVSRRDEAGGIQHKLRILYSSVRGTWQIANVVDLVVTVQKNGLVVPAVLDHRVISAPNAHVQHAQLVPTQGLYDVADRELAFRHIVFWTEVEGPHDKIPSKVSSEILSVASKGAEKKPTTNTSAFSLPAPKTTSTGAFTSLAPKPTKSVSTEQAAPPQQRYGRWVEDSPYGPLPWILPYGRFDERTVWAQQAINQMLDALRTQARWCPPDQVFDDAAGKCVSPAPPPHSSTQPTTAQPVPLRGLHGVGLPPPGKPVEKPEPPTKPVPSGHPRIPGIPGGGVLIGEPEIPSFLQENGILDEKMCEVLGFLDMGQYCLPTYSDGFCNGRWLWAFGQSCPLPRNVTKSEVVTMVDCWLPDPSSWSGRWTGPQMLGSFRLSREALGEPAWLGEYHFGTFVDALGSRTKFFVPWVVVTDEELRLMGSLISF